MAEPCEHKPLIDCALTALPGCCACADKRPIAIAYPVYIDGLGMRLQGKRWQCYCWKCRGRSHLRFSPPASLSHSSSPLYYHQPLIISHSLINILVNLHPSDYWNLRSQSPSLSSPIAVEAPSPHAEHVSNPPVPSPEDNMSRLFRRRNDNDNHSSLPNDQPSSWSFNGIGEARQTSRYESPENPSDQPIDSSRYAVVRPPPILTGSQPENRQPGIPHSRPIVPIRQPNSPDITILPPPIPRRNRPPIPNPFGTREEIESEDYQSPVAQLFGRAWNRHREANQTNQPIPQWRALALAEEERARNSSVDILGTGPPRPEELRVDRLMEQGRLHGLSWTNGGAVLYDLERALRSRENRHAHPRANPVDQQSSRPPPLESAEMTISIACRICSEQKVDTLLEPCMHLAICHWCSELIREQARRRRNRHPPRNDDGDRWRCPICRHDVMRARRVYLA